MLMMAIMVEKNVLQDKLTHLFMILKVSDPFQQYLMIGRELPIF